MLVTLSALLTLVGCSREAGSPHSVLDQQALGELDAKCGREAKAWYATAHGNDRPPASEVRDLASHYHAGSHRCLAVFSTTVARGYVSTEIIDVDDNTLVGAYRLNAGQNQPVECEINGKPCSSSEEWRSLTDAYLHQ